MTIRQMWYTKVGDYTDLCKTPGLYRTTYLRTRTLECLFYDEYVFQFLALACAADNGIKKPTVRELNKMFREVILFDPKKDILCQNYQNSNSSLFLRVREYVLVQDYVRAMQLYLVYLCNR